MTDKEIIELVEYYKETADEITIAELSFDEMSNILDLINRQQAEIERLQKVQVQYVKAYFDEFVERLKFDISLAKLDSGLLDYVIDELVETMKIEFSREADFTDLIKSEAIKEFAERLKGFRNGDYIFVTTKLIDNLVKEMLGDENDT